MWQEAFKRLKPSYKNKNNLLRAFKDFKKDIAE